MHTQLRMRSLIGFVIPLVIHLTGQTIWAETVDYTYDTMGRLTRAESDAGPMFVYTYDTIGNRLSAETSATGQDPTLIASYPFSEGSGTTAADASGNGHDGTLYHGATWSAGTIGTGMQFDGVDDYIALNMFYDQVGHIPEVTTCAWFRTSWSGIDYYDNWAFIDFDRSEYYTLYLRGDTGTLGFSTTSLAGTEDMAGNTVANDGQWHFACAVYDGTNKILYLDGQEDGRIANAHSGESLGTGMLRYGVIGDGSEADILNGPTNSFYYEGALDEISIYHRALSAEEIQELYTQQPPIDVPFEVGQVTLDSTIDEGVTRTVAFEQTYTNPVVVAYIMTRNGNQSVEVRVKNVTSTSCTLFMEEPDDGAHMPEEIGYLVMEAGEYTLPDGTHLEASTVTTASVHREGDAFGGTTVPFTQAFATAPVVLHTLQTYNNGAFMSSVAPQVSSTDFLIQQEACGSGAMSVVETIGWIAVDAGMVGTINGIFFETGRAQDGTLDGVDDTAHLFTYTANFLQAPIIVVKGYTGYGGGGYWTRSSGMHTVANHGVFAEEDQIQDPERSHADEGFGFWALAHASAEHEGLVASYPFSEGSGTTTADVSGNGYDATLLNGVAWTSDSIDGTALSFDGVDDYVTGGYPKAINNFTVAAWVKPQSAHEIDPESSSGTLGNSGQKYLWYPYYEDPGAGVGVSVGTNGISVYEHSGFYLPALAVYQGNLGTEWHHLAITYTERQPRIYLDGGLVHTGLTSPQTSVISPIYIGGDGHLSGGYGYFDGLVDEIKIYERALSASDIQALYTASAPSAMSLPMMAPALVERASDPTAEPLSNPANEMVAINGQILHINVGDSPELNYGVGDFTVVIQTSRSDFRVEREQDGTATEHRTHTAVGLRRDDDLVLYLDGAEQARRTIGDRAVNHLTIRVDREDVLAPISIDDVQLYNRALSPEEVTGLNSE